MDNTSLLPHSRDSEKGIVGLITLNPDLSGTNFHWFGSGRVLSQTNWTQGEIAGGTAVVLVTLRGPLHQNNRDVLILPIQSSYIGGGVSY